MKSLFVLFTVAASAICVGILGVSPLAGQAGKAAQPARPGRLIVWGDLALFQPPTHPEGCTLRNRFKRGDPVGFRLFALDGATNQTEPTAELVVHLNYAGRTINIPALYRGVQQFVEGTRQPMPINPKLWTAKWIVPNDAATGVVRYTVTGRDRYGRMVEFTPPGPEPSLLTIVQ